MILNSDQWKSICASGIRSIQKSKFWTESTVYLTSAVYMQITPQTSDPWMSYETADSLSIAYRRRVAAVNYPNIRFWHVNSRRKNYRKSADCPLTGLA